MTRANAECSVRVGNLLIVVSIALLAMTLSACSFDTKTEMCAVAGKPERRCRQGQVCTTRGVCADINTCGDDFVDKELGEECEDGNLDDGDGCDSNCRFTRCGNGIQTAGEICDDGNLVDGDGCDSNCTPTYCGNGVVTEGEACDDGNQDNFDACLTSCVLATCGDGLVQAGVEECDDGNAITEACPYGAFSCMICNERCEFREGETARCGDQVKQASDGEICEDGNLTCGTCSPDCKRQLSDYAEGRVIVNDVGSIQNGKIFVLNDGLHPPVTFEFWNGMGSAPSNAVLLTGMPGGSPELGVRDAIILAITQLGNALQIEATKQSDQSPVVILKNRRATALGNVDIVTTITNGSIQVVGMDHGGGGDCPGSAPCMFDDDCASGRCIGNVMGMLGHCDAL